MKYLSRIVILIVFLIGFYQSTYSQQTKQSFTWPEGKKIALSLTFDDARASQVNGGTELLNRYDVKATFYAVPENVRPELDGWKKAVAAGHEIGNHSLNHPCTGNFEWSQDHALEDYTLEMMRSELIEANQQIESLLGITPGSFAYPCGEMYVGRGTETKSYVPLIAEIFSSGRSWQDESANSPVYWDFAHLRGQEMDGKDFNEILPILETAKENGQWVILGGHEIADMGFQTTRLSMLEELIKYAQNPDNGIWLAPVKEVTAYINEYR